MDNSELITAHKVLMVMLTITSILLVIKLYLYILTWSIAIFAYAMDTLYDFITDATALWATNKALEPPDADHPYGHGKFEAFARVFIGFLLIFTALEISIESIARMVSGARSLEIPSKVLNILTGLIIVYIIMAMTEYIFYKRTKIKVLEASMWHYFTDPFSTLIIMISLMASSQGMYIADPLAALLVCLILGYSGVKIIFETSPILMDAQIMDPEEIRRIIRKNFGSVVKDCHKIKTRTDGFQYYLECHILVDPNITVKEGHDIADKIEKVIRRSFPDKQFRDVIIHVEPYEEPHQD